MTLKRPEAVKNITAYLREHDLEAVIRENFPKIDEDAFWFPKNSTLPERMELLAAHRNALCIQIRQLQENMEKLDSKIEFYRTEIERMSNK